MAKQREISYYPVAPLTGVLDMRSTPETITQTGIRRRQNFDTIADGKIRRGRGWAKLLDEAPYGNADMHDQWLTEGELRQPITYLTEIESTRKVRYLIAATQSRISILDDYSSVWVMLNRGYGGEPSVSAAAPRFRSAQVGDYLVLTNDFDPPQYHIIEQVPLSEDELLINTIPDMALLGISRVAVVWSWHNVMFYADVEMDGARYAYRFYWSDFSQPISLDPGVVGSIAGFRDLYTHERIMAAKPLSNSCLIYTTHGIWEMVVAGGERSFDVARRYDGDDNLAAGVLKYPNTLAALPDAHVYMAQDGIYLFSPYYGKPNRMEYIHRASSYLYDNLDDVNCSVHVSNFASNQLLFSVASKDALNQCPDKTLRINLNYQAADVIDHGFTALCQFRPQRVPTVQDFLDKYVCDPAIT